MPQSVTSCFINSSIYTVVVKTVLTACYRNFMFDSVFYENLCDNSETDLGYSKILENINYAFLAHTAIVLSPSVDTWMTAQCSFPL
jgi:hypothetical protein